MFSPKWSYITFHLYCHWDQIKQVIALINQSLDCIALCAQTVGPKKVTYNAVIQSAQITQRFYCLLRILRIRFCTFLLVCFLFICQYLFPLFTFQMVLPFLVTPPKIPYPICPPCLQTVPHIHFPDMAFPYTGASSLHRSNGLSSHWCLKWPSSATKVAGAIGSLCLVFQTLGALGIMVGTCSFCGD